jgi:hypothetical protein
MRYHLEHSWEITDDGLDMTHAELVAEALTPGGPLDDALFEHHVSLAGDPSWQMETATDEPRLRVVVPVVLWHTRRDPAPADHPMRRAA